MAVQDACCRHADGYGGARVYTEGIIFVSVCSLFQYAWLCTLTTPSAAANVYVHMTPIVFALVESVLIYT